MVAARSRRLSLRRVARAVVAGVALLALSYVILIACFQRRLLYPRPSVAGAAPRPSDAQQVWLATSFGRVEAWYLPPQRERGSKTPLIIYFHGNGELIDSSPALVSAPRSWGMGVLLVEFPGYGRSDGEPSEQSIRAAALAAHDWARARADLDSARIVAYGRSLGGAAAAILATERRTRALVLESTFTSIKSFAHQLLVPELVVLDPFDTEQRLAAYAGSVLVLHGDRDRLIPLRHAEQLARTAPKAQLQVLHCGHNDCARPWATLRAFLRDQGLL
jgi:uncharacterized protein